MQGFNLSQDDFDRVLRIYQRILINDLTPAADFKPFLIARLQAEAPETAAKIQGLDQGQLDALWMHLTEAVRAGSGTALWQ